MIDSFFRTSYQKAFVDPLLKNKRLQQISPQTLTLFGCAIGVSSGIFLWLSLPWVALAFLLFSGYLDTLDGSLAWILRLSSDKGAVLDIVCDRTVEWSVIVGLFLVDPMHRGIYCILMLGSVLICITSFLVVGVFSENKSEKSFHYSPGLMERTEAFFFFALMILTPQYFAIFSSLFTLLAFLTSFLRLRQFHHHSASS